MNIFIIATVWNKNRQVGYRLLDTDDKNKTLDVPTAAVVSVVSAGGAKINNAELLDGSVLVGTQGNLSNYSRVDSSTKQFLTPMKIVVLNQIGDVGYTVAGPQGVVRRIKTQEAVDLCKQHGLANGIVGYDNGREVIVSLGEKSYDVLKVAASKVGGNMAEGIKISTDKTATANHVKADVDNELGYNDVFKCMNDTQKKVLKDYYVWYTLEVYKAMAKNIRLSLAVGKAEVLSELRGDKKWVFDGIWDAGFRGASHCELGHPLRYEYYAIPEDEVNDKSARIVFGETCASDFFDISPEDMRKLIKTRKIMSDELAEISEIMTDDGVLKHRKKYRILWDILERGENINELFGPIVGRTLVNFKLAGLPFPMSLVINAGKEFRKDSTAKFKVLFTKYSDTIDWGLSLTTRDWDYQLGIQAKGMRNLINYFSNYLIEGEYMYNPFDEEKRRKDVGRYNDTTRSVRSNEVSLLRMGTALSIPCRVDYGNFALKDIEQYLKYMALLKRVGSAGETPILNDIEVSAAYKLAEQRIGKINRSKDIVKTLKSYVERSKGDDDGISQDTLDRINVFIHAMAIKEGEGLCIRYRIGYHNYGTVRRYTSALKNDLRYIDLDSLSPEEVIAEVLKIFLKNAEVFELAQKEKERRLEEERLKQEQERQEREKEKQRLEREKKETERQRLEREKSEAEKKESESGSDSEDKLEVLERLLKEKEGQYDPNEYGFKVAINIVGKYTNYECLSKAQKWRVDNTISCLRGEADKNKKEFKDLEGEFKELVEKILSANDEVRKSIDEADSIAFKIARSVKQKGKYTDKQKKHIDAVAKLVE